MRKKDRAIYIIAGFSLAILLSIAVSMVFVMTGLIKFDFKGSPDARWNMEIDIDNLPDWVKEKFAEFGDMGDLNLDGADMEDFAVKGIFVMTDSATKPWDGTPLTCDTYKAYDELLKEGHHLVVKPNGSQTDVGSSSNYAYIAVFDEYGNDVSNEYRMYTYFGTLTITDGETAADEKDLSDLMKAAGAIMSGALGGSDQTEQSGQTETEQSEQAETELLSVYADMDGLIYLRNKSFGDYTGNGFTEAVAYSKNGEKGAFNQAAANIAVSDNSVAISLLVDSDTAFIPIYATTDFVLKNDVEVDFFSKDYKVEFKNYDYLESAAELHSGDLSEYNAFVYEHYLNIDEYLKTRLLELARFDCQGKELIDAVAKYVKNAATYNSEYKEIPDGEDTILYFLTKSKEGVCRHFAAAATMIYRAYGIPARYTVGVLVDAKKGQLVKATTREAHAWVEVYLDDVGWVSVDATGGGFMPTGGRDGGIYIPEETDLADGGTEITDEPFDMEEFEVLKILSDGDDLMYLRITSYGDYSGKGFAAAPVYSYGFNGTESVFNPTVNAVSGSEVGAKITVLANSGYRLIPYYSKDVYRIVNDVKIECDETEYYVNYLKYDYLYGTDIYAAADLTAYNGFVKNNYLTIDGDLKAQLIYLTGFSSSGKTLIKDIADYVKNAAVYNKEFAAFPEGEDMVLYFLTEGKEGICQHFASAATMIYRAYGIPARYTVGYVAAVRAGEETTVMSGSAHAWVEIYLEDIGWVRIETTGAGGVPDYRRTLKIVSDDKEKIYDGTPLFADEIGDGVSLLGELQDGHRIEVSDTLPSVKNVNDGEKDNVPDFRIVDEDGNDCTADYILDYSDCGTISVVPCSMELSLTGEKTYDGTTAISAGDITGGEVRVGGEVSDGLEVQVIDVAGELPSADAGEYETEIENVADNIAVRIYDDGEDITDNFVISSADLDFTVNKRDISVETSDYTTEYNGKKQSGGTVSADNLVSGQKISAMLIGQTDAGEYENGILDGTLRITDADGTHDYTDNYNIADYDFGTLKITPKTVYVFSAGDEKVYDGTPLTGEPINGQYYVFVGFINGHSATYTATEIVNVGKTGNVPTDISINGGAVPVSDYYFNYDNCGTLEITPKTVYVCGDGGEKTYDGAPLTGANYYFDGLIDGHVPSYNKATITDAGSKDDMPTDIKINGNAQLAANYDFVCSGGTLTVNPCQITVSLTGEKIYDGATAVSADDITNTEVIREGGAGLYNGQIAKFFGISLPAADVESYSFEVAVSGVSVNITENGKNIPASNYEILSITAEITVNKRDIVVKTSDYTATYNGETQFGGTVYADNCVSGQKVSATFIGQINAGEYENAVDTVSVHITNAFGAHDYKDNYNITGYEYGAFIINPKTVSVLSDNAEKEYDGTPLKNENYTFDGLISGHVITSLTPATLTDVGKIENMPRDIRVNADDTLTNNYSFVYKSGTLTVHNPRISVEIDDAYYDYDGAAHAVSATIANIKVGTALKGGHRIEIIGYPSITNVSESGIYNAPDFIVADGYGNDVSEEYEIVYENCGRVYIAPKTVYVGSVSAEKEYDGTPLYGTDYIFNGLIIGHEPSYAAAHITDVGETDNVPDNILINGDMGLADNYYFDYSGCGTLKVNKRVITVKSADAEREYNGIALTDDTAEITEGSLPEGQEIVYSFTGKQKDVGSSENTFIAEIYSGAKNVSANYKVNYVYGTLTVKPCKITIALMGEKTYDGTASAGTIINMPTDTVVFRDGGTGLYNDQTLVVSGINLPAADAGTYNFEIEQNDVSIAIYEDGAGVPLGNYDILSITVNFTVNKRDIIVYTSGYTTTYNGDRQKGGTVYADNLLAGHIITAEFIGAVDAGEYENAIYTETLSITDNGNTHDYTDNYNAVNYFYGILKINRLIIYFESENEEVLYDGAIHYGNYTYNAPIAGHKVSYTAASMVEPGTVDNRPENVRVIVINSGENISKNYEFDFDGCTNKKLTVNKRALTITTATLSKPYDGTPLTNGNSGLIITGDGVLEGRHEIVADFYGEQTDKGSSPNYVDIIIRDNATEEDVSVDYYNIIIYHGTLTVN